MSRNRNRPEPICRSMIKRLTDVADDMEKKAEHLRQMARTLENMANENWGRPPEASEL